MYNTRDVSWNREGCYMMCVRFQQGQYIEILAALYEASGVFVMMDTVVVYIG